MGIEKKYLRRSLLLAFFLSMLFASYVHADDPLIVDDSADFTSVFDSSGNIAVTSSSPEKYGNDNSRFYKNSASDAYIIYNTPGDMTQFAVETWYNKNKNQVVPGDMRFYASADNEQYELLSAVTKTVHDEGSWPIREWRKIDWETSSLPEGTRFLKIVFGNTSGHGDDWAIQIGRTTIHGEAELPADPDIVTIDETSDFTNLFEQTTGVTLFNFEAQNDSVYRAAGPQDYFIYRSPTDMTSFRAEAWYYKRISHIPGDIAFEASADNVTYVPVANVSKEANTSSWANASEWRKFVWEAASLPPGTKYLKVKWGDTSGTGVNWTIQYTKTTMNSIGYRTAVQLELDKASSKLDSSDIGTQPGMYPPAAAADLEAAIEDAEEVADNAAAAPGELKTAYEALLETIDRFNQSILTDVNWPYRAEMTATVVEDSGQSVEVALSWPTIVENDDVQYTLYQNGEPLAQTAGTGYTVMLDPYKGYEFSVTAATERGVSKVLGPLLFKAKEIGPVPAPDFSLIDPDDFADEDYIAPRVWQSDNRGIPYYFYHFHTVANAVRLEEPDRGFIDITVHRSPGSNRPSNVRVQENHLWLAYFYTRQASWNIYYGMPEVRLRLEAVLEHMLTLQQESGMFTQGCSCEHDPAGTTFAMQFLGQTIRLLNEAAAQDPNLPALDEDLYDRLIVAYRKAIMYVLNDATFWTHATYYSNQYTLAWSGIAAYLAYYPDQEIYDRMLVKYEEARTALISPAGFYYEGGAYDMSYNMGVHMQNLMGDYHYFKDTPFMDHVIAKESVYFDWLSYNLVLEPDGSFFTSNAAPSNRQASTHIERKDIPLAEALPLARAFVRSDQEIADEIARNKSELAAGGSWPNVPELSLTSTGNSYNPYGLYNRILYNYHPTEADKAEAIGMLPYMARDRFNHQRVDDRADLTFTYVRKPAYYAAFNAGERTKNIQAFGLGLLWHPEAGIMLASQTEVSNANQTNKLAWGTRFNTGNRVYESWKVSPSYEINGQPIEPSTGYGDLPQGDLTLSYNIGAGGDKSVSFVEDGIEVGIDAATASTEFTEYFPLMIKDGDILDLGDEKVTLTRGNVVMEIAYEGDAEASVEAQDYHIFQYTIHVLELKSTGPLHYKITLSTEEAPE